MRQQPELRTKESYKSGRENLLKYEIKNVYIIRFVNKPNAGISPQQKLREEGTHHVLILMFGNVANEKFPDELKIFGTELIAIVHEDDVLTTHASLYRHRHLRCSIIT